MSVSRNFGRTLSGATDVSIDNLRIGDNLNSIRINGNAGLPNQVIAKNGTTNKLEWDFVETTTIPDGSITGNKLADNINIDTTGTIDAETIRANTFIAPKTGTGIVKINTDNGAGIDINNGANIRMFSDSGGSNTLLLDGNTGTITIGSNGKIQTYGVSEIMKILNGGEINFYDDNSGLSKTISIVGETGTITCDDLNIDNGGNIDVFDTNDLKRIELISEDCEIKLNNNSGNNNIKLDGINNDISVFLGGNIRLYEDDPQPAIFINLNGSNGLISCRDIDITNHSGTIEFNEIRTNKITLPETGTPNCEIFDTGKIVSNGTITAGSIAGTSLSSSSTITATGSITGNSLVSNSSITGSTLTATGIVSCNQLLTKTGSATNTILNSNGLTISGAEKEINANGCLIQVSDLFVNGNHGTTSAIISGNVNITNSTGDTPQDGDLTIAGDISSTNGNITLTNGDITLTTGTFRGNVDGTITEEHIDGESLRLRTNPNGAGTPQGLIIEDGFRILGYTGDQTSTNRIDIDCASGVIRHGGIQQTLNTGGNSFSSQTTFNGTSVINGNSNHNIGIFSTWNDNNTSSNSNGVRGVVINGDGVKLYPADGGVERLRVDRDGKLDFKTTTGSINGFTSTSLPTTNITNMNLFDNDNVFPHPRFTKICDPTIHSVYTMSGGWRNMAGYVGNNPSKARFTNADLTFTALGEWARFNIIFSASVNNNMGVAVRIQSINGSYSGARIASSRRLFIGSASHRGQHEYTCYTNNLVAGYDYVMTPEVYIGGSSNITMYVGSRNGSGTIQNADSPIIFEVSFMDNVARDIGNLYEPPSEDY